MGHIGEVAELLIDAVLVLLPIDCVLTPLPSRLFLLASFALQRVINTCCYLLKGLCFGYLLSL